MRNNNTPDTLGKRRYINPNIEKTMISIIVVVFESVLVEVDESASFEDFKNKFI